MCGGGFSIYRKGGKNGNTLFASCARARAQAHTDRHVAGQSMFRDASFSQTKEQIHTRAHTIRAHTRHTLPLPPARRAAGRHTKQAHGHTRSSSAHTITSIKRLYSELNLCGILLSRTTFFGLLFALGLLGVYLFRSRMACIHSLGVNPIYMYIYIYIYVYMCVYVYIICTHTYRYVDI